MRRRFGREGERKPKYEAEYREIEQVMGEDFFGPKEIKEAWGVSADDCPPPAFTREELEQAKERGMVLILRIQQDSRGRDLTVENMHEHSMQHDSLLHQSFNTYHDGEDWYEKEKPNVGWAMVSKDLIPESKGRDFLGQTRILLEELKKYLVEEDLSEEQDDDIRNIRRQRISDAIKEAEEVFSEGQNSKLNIALRNNRVGEIFQILDKLKINKLHRRSLAEAYYDYLTMFRSRVPELPFSQREMTNSGKLEYGDYGSVLNHHVIFGGHPFSQQIGIEGVDIRGSRSDVGVRMIIK